MSTKFKHGADEVLSYVLWASLNLGTNPDLWNSSLSTGADGGAWPVFSGGAPESPDELICVTEQSPQNDAKLMPDGSVARHYNLTVSVRGQTKPSARQKAEDVQIALNEQLYDLKVTVPATVQNPNALEYLVQSVPRVLLVPVGRDVGSSQRWLVNLNCLAVILAYPIGR